MVIPRSLAFQNVAQGTITTQNLNPATGVPTAASTVVVDTNGMSTLAIQTTGTYTGALTLQGTLDDVNWVSFGGLPLINVNTGGSLVSITSALQSVFQADVSAFSQVRISANAAVTGSVVVTLSTSLTDAMVGLDSPLPAGANTIGAVTMVTAGSPPAATSHDLTAAATTNATSVKGTAANLYEVSLTNYAAYTTFFKVYNKATAPTVGTDIPVATLEVAANSSRVIEFGALGLRLTTGYAFAMTKLQADTDTTVLVAGDLKVIGAYI